ADILKPIKIITTKSKIKICRDPDDDKFIACAVDGKCKYIVSGDNDLLSVKPFKNVQIVSVREFMDKYRM
ncbi:MAG: putative toxin-antitoxin system toxin component, PIN family, partial [Chitinispirillales bacterium]|nr:putative toxin-antitoxin system toxin component, PIN family [Chitinispirillales bacterium]